ncbi:LamG-like jellyroll fold domain-containing protein [Actinoplanes sp. NPDC026670]|uniref:LamG-like jellyroll fold domain-containing protein n=1 Tax=Actinoplanes sp. NPDC026670 TaxID=3154700 RepID=UPI0033E9506C
MRLLRSIAVTVVAAAVTVVAPQGAAGAAVPGRRVVLSEDFSAPTLNTGLWLAEETGGWKRVNDGDQQWYSPSADNVYIDHDNTSTGAGHGALALAVTENPRQITYPDGTVGDYRYASGRVQTETKLDVTYGSMSARMKLPALPGTWPAFWTLGLDGARWPANGEIDIMENVGDPRWTSVGAHFPGRDPLHTADHGLGFPSDSYDTNAKRAALFPAGFDAAGWHVYRADWSPGAITFLIDEREVFRLTADQVTATGAWVFDQPQYLILNMAIGGGYPKAFNGEPDGLPAATETAIKAGGVRTLVDWVQVIDNRPAGLPIDTATADATTGEVLRFDQVDVGAGTGSVQMRAVSSRAGQILVRAGSPTAAPVATVAVTDTGGATATVSAAVSSLPPGVHTIYITRPAATTIDSFTFGGPPYTLRGYWPLDAAGDPVVTGGATLITDVRAGQGRAIRFDGMSGQASTGGPVVDTGQSFTVTAWVRLTSAGGYHTAVGQDGAQASAFYLQRAGSGRWTFAVPATDTVDPAFATAVGGPAVVNRWTHLAGVYDAAAATVTLYVDGIRDATAGTVAGRAFTSSGPLTIGRSKYNGWAGNFWPGDIDDVRVLSGVLPAQQISRLALNTPA